MRRKRREKSRSRAVLGGSDDEGLSAVGKKSGGRMARRVSAALDLSLSFSLVVFLYVFLSPTVSSRFPRSSCICVSPSTRSLAHSLSCSPSPLRSAFSFREISNN